MAAHDEIEHGQPFDLLHCQHQCRARWRSGRPGRFTEAYLRVGVLDDGRWFVAYTGQQGTDARAYSSREGAWVVARNLMAGERQWLRVPCYPTQGWQPGERPADDSQIWPHYSRPDSPS